MFKRPGKELPQPNQIPISPAQLSNEYKASHDLALEHAKSYERFAAPAIAAAVGTLVVEAVDLIAIDFIDTRQSVAWAIGGLVSAVSGGICLHWRKDKIDDALDYAAKALSLSLEHSMGPPEWVKEPRSIVPN